MPRLSGLPSLNFLFCIVPAEPCATRKQSIPDGHTSGQELCRAYLGCWAQAFGSACVGNRVGLLSLGDAQKILEAMGREGMLDISGECPGGS
ncbi:hypothetical protein AUP68_08125 [Ilyonectria robusta]